MKQVTNRYNNVIFLFLLVVLSMQVGCAGNIAYRISGCKENNCKVQECKGDRCKDAVIERHTSKDENYDLAFVEFTERGNLFDRKQLNLVLNHIEYEEKNNSVTLLVYVHGWKNNASNKPRGDVDKFRKLLKIISKNQIETRKIVGVYIGWRGASLTFPLLDNLTYWARKNVARQVGNGGVSEVLLRLNRIVKNDKGNNENIFVIAGHSFGAAVTISAIKDILIDKIVNAQKIDYAECTISKFKKVCQGGCYKTEPFGDGIILLNPAIEANEFVQLKELVAEEECYTREQPKLLHIISSDADTATKYAFNLGQFLGVSIRKKEEKLKRNFFSTDMGVMKEVILDEYDLDTQTIGNYSPFRTGLSRNIRRVGQNDREDMCKGKRDYVNKALNECFTPCEGKASCVDKEEAKDNIPISPYEPISIIYTHADYMKNHNDIFNSTITAYIISAILENQYKRDESLSGKGKLSSCFKENKDFNFSGCLEFFKGIYEEDFKHEFPQVDI